VNGEYPRARGDVDHGGASMTRPDALTKPGEKQITEDWQKEIPTLGIYVTLQPSAMGEG
jgi:hypothetical protein